MFNNIQYSMFNIQYSTLVGGAGILRDGGGAGREYDALQFFTSPVAGFAVGIIKEVEAVATLDVAATIFGNAVAIARDVEDGAHGVVAGVSGEGAGLGLGAAGGDAYRLGFAALGATGKYGLALPIEFPTATTATGAVGCGFNRNQAPLDEAVADGAIFANKQAAAGGCCQDRGDQA
jgi:hypothetical protein